MEKRKIWSIMLGGILAFSLVGCSGNAAETGATGNSDKASKEGVIEIRFTNWDGGDTLKVYNQVVEKFNATHPNIHVTNLNIPSEYDTKITAMVAGNDIPEVAILNSDTLLFKFAEQGTVLNMQELIDNDESFDETSMLDLFKYKLDSDFLAGYGVGSENICMFYNPVLFEQYGVEEPPASYEDAWDWDTFVHNAKKLTIDMDGRNALDPEFDPTNIDVYGVSFGKWWAMYMPFIQSLGGDYLNEEGTAIGYDSPEAIEAMQKLADLIWVHHVAPTPTTSSTMPGLSEAIATNKVAMQFDGQWSNMGLMLDGINYNVAALPKMGEKASTVTTFGAVAVMNTEKADAAWEFVKFLLSEGACEELYKSGVWLPTNANEYTEEYIKTFITDKHPSNYYEAIVKPMMDGTALPPVTARVANFTKINDIITPALDEVWAGEKSYEEAIKGIADIANKEVKGFLGQ